ncbi:MAG: glycosyltransferase family 2 protein [Candidatus Gastranaerophilales bacterium]|nr:glycosyltransferase family 2 protein [Candidatus Gastranaerophilales bacterium]
MEDLISIVVPVYNVEPYLEKCLDSIQRQNYTNLEVLLVDICIANCIMG